MTVPQPIRLLMDSPRNGVENMAIDEAMLHWADSGEATLRLYSWSQPTVSLGYFQKWADWRGQVGPHAALPAVRRITGGGAIIHADELTYSLALPLAGPQLAALGGGEHVTGLYPGFHAAIAGAAVGLGARAGAMSPAGREAEAAASGGRADEPFLCFARRSRYDLVAGGRKLVGSAQRCLSRAVLQHGSVVLRADGAQDGAAGLAGVLGRAITWDDFAQALLAELAQCGLDLQPGELSPAERDGLGGLLTKHRSQEWLELR